MNCLEWLNNNSASSEDTKVFYVLGENLLERNLIEKYWYQSLREKYPGIQKTDMDSACPAQIKPLDWYLQVLTQRTLIPKPALYLMNLDRFSPSDKKRILETSLISVKNHLYFLIMTGSSPGIDLAAQKTIVIGNKTKALDLPALLQWILRKEHISLPDSVTNRLVQRLSDNETGLLSEVSKLKYLMYSEPKNMDWDAIYPEPLIEEDFFTLVRALVDKDPRIWFLNWKLLKDSDNILLKIRQQLQTLERIKRAIPKEMRPKFLLLAQKAKDSRNRKTRQDAILEIKALLNQGTDSQMENILSKEARIPYLIRDQARFDDEELDEMLMDLGRCINETRSKNSSKSLIPKTLLTRLFGSNKRFLSSSHA